MSALIDEFKGEHAKIIAMLKDRTHRALEYLDDAALAVAVAMAAGLMIVLDLMAAALESGEALGAECHGGCLILNA